MELDVVTLLRPLQFFATLCGICPSLETGQAVSTSSLIYSCSLLVYPAWFFGTVFLLYYSFFKDIASFTMSLSQIVYALNHFVRTGIPLSSAHEFKKIFQTIRHAEDLLFSENIAQDAIPSQRSQMCWIICTVLYAIVYIINSVFIDLGFYEVTSCVIYFLSTMAYFFQLRGFITLLKNKFIILNWHFNDLNNQVPSFLITPTDVSKSDFSSVSEFRNTMFVQPQFASRKVSAKKIRAFNQIHFLLCSACHQLDSYFSLQNLMNTLQSGFVFISVPMFLFSTTFYQYASIPSKIAFFLRSADILVNTVIMLKLAHEVQSEVIILQD